MRRVLRGFVAAIALLATSACASPVAPPARVSAVDAAESGTIIIEVPPTSQEALALERPSGPSYGLMAMTRRWRPSDVYQVTVRLTRWNGTAFVDLPTPLEVVLPQKGAIKTQARFGNLAQGQRYRAIATAWGNAGGTAPTLALNTLFPSVADFDLSTAQDVQNALGHVMRVTLDPAPFNGTAVIIPVGAPSNTMTYELTLMTESGSTVLRTTFTRRQTMTLYNLRAGLPYRVLLTARRANGLVTGTASAPLAWDASAPELEQAVSVQVDF